MVQKIQNKLQSFDAYVSMALGLAAVLIVGAVVFNMAQKNKEGDVSDESAQAEAQKELKPGETALPAEHTVREGEKLWSIAEFYYKSGYNWTDIAEANSLTSPDDIKAGDKITIPAVTAKKLTLGEVSSATTEINTPEPTAVPAEPTEAPKAPQDKTYTVVKGDSLWKIAVAQYNDGYKWVEIARANKLVNPNLIHPGNELVMP